MNRNILMKKVYKQPTFSKPIDPGSAAPLAFFSAATAAASAIGATAGVLGTKALIRATPDERRNASMISVKN